MRISSLELSGFKSFHKKTRLEFHKGSNGIVGPNGCGKSNVIDAVRWVIGEQSPGRLRARAMEDLISDGTVSLKPLGMAEVTMTLSEVPGGFEDVSITRRYYRDGESEYLLNGVACRLKDIADIFMDTGAGVRSNSIIGQGEVEGFVMSKPEEKRRLIEEVAGIVKYRARRREAHSKLKSTEENLDRIKSLGKDALRRTETLQRQAEQACKLGELNSQAARLELLMLGCRMLQSENKMRFSQDRRQVVDRSVGDIEAEKNSAASRLKTLEEEARSLESAVSLADSEILAAREKINGEISSKDLSERRSADIDGIIVRLEGEKLSLERQSKEIAEQVVAARSEAESAGEKISNLRSEIETCEKDLSSLKDGADSDREGLERHRNEFFSAVEQCDGAESSYRELTAEIERLSAASAYLSEQKKVLLDEKQKLSEQREQFVSQIERISGAQEQSRKQRTGLADRLGSFGDEHKKLLEETASLKELRNSSASRLEELCNIQKSFEWLPESSRKLLVENKADGILGVLPDYVKVPPKYVKAFDAALGERLGWIVVGTGADASRAIGKLRKNKTGRATFMPLSSAPDRKSFSIPEGALPFSEVVRTEGEGGDVIRNLLEGVCVVDNLSKAFECAEVSRGLSFATLEGDFLDSSGAVSGGWTAGGVFERKSEIDRLTGEVPELDRRIEKLLKQSGDFEVRMDDLKTEMASLDEHMQTDRVKLGSLERDLEEFNFSFEGKGSKLAEIEDELSAVSGRLREKTVQTDTCRHELRALRERRDGMKNRLSEFEEKSSGVEARESALSGQLGSLKIDLSTLERDRENFLHRLESLAEREREVSAQMEKISGEMTDRVEEKNRMKESSGEAGRRIETLEAGLKKKLENVVEIRSRRTEVASQTGGLRSHMEKLDKRVEDERRKRADIDVNLRTMENNIEYMSSEIAAIIEKTGAEMPGTDEVEAVKLEETKAAFTALKTRIDGFGLVNLLAPEEYEEAKKEHGFLETQIEDLEKSADSLKKSISCLDRDSADKFTEALEEVDLKFRELLPTLFQGGDGRLVMTNPDDPIETGIEIMVKPGGKKFQNMSLLSGGEKALTAIAFIISSCLVRPLPFIILDEIDAPLDDSNTGRFSALIKDISRNSQTLVVTHNKTTIADVDALIGITASKASNSAVVSVDLAKAV